jgi:CubicO group peptidase (beta-lactamase class C family)
MTVTGRLALAVLLAFFHAFALHAQTDTSPRDRLESARRVLDDAVSRGTIGSAVGLIARADEIVLLHGAGDIGPGVPMPVNAIARLASIQKPITATAVLLLHERGLLQLTDAVDRWFPGFGARVLTERGDTVPAERAITIHDLLTHQAGLIGEGAEYDTLWETATTHDFARGIGAIPLRFQPGSAYDYGCCGSAYEVLAAIVERVSGKTLKEFLTTEVLHPLRMYDTYFFVPAPHLDRLATHYRVTDGALAVARPRGAESPETAFYAGGGSLRSTVTDYHRFLLMLLRGGELDGARILRPETVRSMMTNQIGAKYPAPGYGWGYGARVQTGDPAASALRRATVGAYEWNGGTGTQFILNPADGLIAIVFVPSWPGTPGVGAVRSAFLDAAIATIAR